jgi:CheY-like chemotaxis protein
MPIRVVLADDSFIVREGVQRLLQSVDEIALVATCRGFDSMRAAVEREHPDVVLTDIRMPPTNTDEGIRMAEALRPQSVSKRARWAVATTARSYPADGDPRKLQECPKTRCAAESWSCGERCRRSLRPGGGSSDTAKPAASLPH